MKEKETSEPLYPSHGSGACPMLPSEREAYVDRKEWFDQKRPKAPTEKPSTGR